MISFETDCLDAAGCRIECGESGRAFAVSGTLTYLYNWRSELTNAIAAANPWRFSSEYAEDETGTVYYNYRHYEPVTGRWMQRDPHDAKNALSVNLGELESSCVYASNRPTDDIDLLGLKEKFRDCEPPEVWQTKKKGSVIPPPDGCSVPKSLRWLLPGTKDNPTGYASFLGACNYHDGCYSNCQKDKATCDNEFYTRMLTACAIATAKIPSAKLRKDKRATCEKWARAYYDAVSIGGSSSYKNRQNLNCECGCP